MRRALALGAVLVSIYTTAGCSDRASGTQRAAAPPAVPILAAEVVRKEVPLDVGVIGTVQALTTVGVKAQVSGQVVKVHFTEGQDVKAGQLLFTIDPRPFEATVAQAEANVGRDTAQMRQAEAALAQRRAEVQQALANLERDQAQLENARVQERRYKTLVEKELVARELYDQFRTNLSALEATLNADRAAVENARAAALAAQAGVDNARAVIRADEAMVETARLNLGYTTIRASMEGRTGNLMLQAGNIVKANDDNAMVVIAQVHPIYVSFAVPQQHLAAIKQYRAAGDARHGAAHFRQQHGGPDHGHDPTQGHLRQRGESAVAGAVRGGRADPHVGVGGGRAVAGRAARPAGPVRLRGEAGSHRAAAARGPGPPSGHGDDRHQGRRARRARRHRRPAAPRARLARGDQAAQGVVSPS